MMSNKPDSDRSDIDDIVNLNMKNAGNAMREQISKMFYENIVIPSWYELPKPTRWQRFKNRMFWRIEDFRIWLSKRIYDWSGYEDE